MDEDACQGADFLRALGIVVADEGIGSASLLRHFDWDCAVVLISFGDSGLVVAIPADVPRRLGLDTRGVITDAYIVPAAAGGTWGPQLGEETVGIRFMVVRYEDYQEKKDHRYNIEGGC